uniref:Viral A-type inclusion protein n=1 Tax=Caenorhabditis tropicalis TaxID=1561998 RepID=A0A1I7U7T9_9PELO
MNSDEEVFDEEEYEESEATMLFAEEIKKQFKKEFPLKAETEKKLKQSTFRRHAPAEARRLNFDMTLSPIAPIELASAKKEKESAQRQLTTLLEEHGRLKQMLKTKEAKLAEKTIDLEMNRERMLELQDQMELMRQEKEDTITECNKSVDIWTSFGKKYYIWYTLASTQLDAVKVYVDNNGKFDNEEEIAQLNAGPRDMMRALEEFEFDEETVEQLSVGSLQEYEGVEFVARRSPSPEIAREVVRSEMSAANFTLPQSNFTILEDQNNTIAQEDQTMMTDGCFANRSLIDYEKDDKIQRLLLENSVLKDRLNVSMSRAEKSMLVEERNRTLEFEKKALQTQLDNTFSEIEAIRIGQARNLFNIDGKVSTETDNSSKQLQLIDKITQLVTKNNQLEKDFEAATSRMTKIMRESSDCERRNERLEDAFSTERVKSQQLESEKNELAKRLESSNDEVSQLNAKLVEMQTLLDDALNRTLTAPSSSEPTSAVPTDAGNTTQIFHMASNPLQAAHAEFQASESRKRKMTDTGDADQFREQQLIDLEERLDMCEREKKVLEDSYNLHKDLASKFRQVCIALTGLQIKLKDADEGICTVQSEFESASTQQFVFKYFYGTPRIDMLDVSGGSTAEILRMWEPMMKKYIGERNSIPAFLAAMTLQLEQERDFDETMHERTHTFSVLHED